MRPFSAGDAKAWVHCPRRAWFDYHPPEGLTVVEDPFESPIFEAGDAQDGGVLSTFPGYTEATSVRHTQELMRAGAPVIYQPHLVDEAQGLIGRPDFLLRAEDGTYRAADAKLATRLDRHKDIAAQVATYRQLIGTPHKALVFLGNGERAEVGNEYDDIRERFQAEMRTLVDSDTMPPAHFGHSRCGACPYDAICRPGFEAAGDLGLSPAIDARSIPGLAAQGFSRISDLADAEVEAIDDVPYLKGEAKKQRAILQASSLLTGQVYVEGQPRLPPDPRIHLDLESDPLARNGEGEVYLWGFLPPPYRLEDYRYIWSDGGSE